MKIAPKNSFHIWALPCGGAAAGGWLVRLCWLTAFSVAMGYLETAVVVYLRALYYPQGFAFPLMPMPAGMAVAEVGREAATLVMLAGVGWLAGRHALERFAMFLYSFAVWDLFYYVFLYLLLGWPDSLLTWDVLFLIPVVWVGPVLAPCLLSLTMIGFAAVVVRLGARRTTMQVPRRMVAAWAAGCVVVVGSFVYDYMAHLLGHHGLAGLWAPGSQRPLFAELNRYVPAHYPWWLFGIGQGLLLAGLAAFWRHNTRLRSPATRPAASAGTFAEMLDGL